MKQTILTVKQSELLERLMVKFGQIVNFDQILAEAKDSWDYKQAKNLITKLVHNGWLIRIKKSLYAISDLSTRGFLSLSPYVVAHLLVNDSYVSFESALAYHDMFDQLTGTVVSVSLKPYKGIHVHNTAYRFVKTYERFYFGCQKAVIDNQTARIATAEKALIDMVHFHKSLYSIDLVREKLIAYHASLDMTRLHDYVSPMSVTTIKIFGFLFDLLGLNSDRLYMLVKAKQSTHWMIARSQKFNAKWRLYYDAYFDTYQASAVHL